MAVQGRSVLGVDINASEICVIELKGAWPDAVIVNADRVATPPGTIENGRIVEPGGIASALRTMLDQAGITARDVVMGIAENCVMTRILDVPAVPANELRTVIEGELAHYQILGGSGGAFDFMPLLRRDDEPEAGPQALVMAAEELIVNGYRAVAEQAGLHLIALEPSLLAMYRLSFSAIHEQPAGVCLAIGRNEAEITITSRGQIRLYRRVDMGRDNLVIERPAAGASRYDSMAGLTPFGDIDELEASQPARPEQPTVINPSAASSLTVEVQRSLDYYASQTPDDAGVGRIVVATTAPELAPLELWLSQSLAIESVLAPLPAIRTSDPRVVSKFEGAERVRFLCAAGLAMREVAGLPASMPRFDLSSQQRTSLVVQSARKRLGISLAASIGAVALGSLLALFIGFKANHVEHELGHLNEHLKESEQIRQEFIASVQTRQDLLRTLKAAGFPFPRIMDSVSSAVVDQVGLTSVALDMGGHLTVNGDASNEKGVIATLENLRKVSYFDSVSMDTFDKLAPTPTNGWVVRFQISCQLTSARRTASAAPVGTQAH